MLAEVCHFFESELALAAGFLLIGFASGALAVAIFALRGS